MLLNDMNNIRKVKLDRLGIEVQTRSSEESAAAIIDGWNFTLDQFSEYGTLGFIGRGVGRVRRVSRNTISTL